MVPIAMDMPQHPKAEVCAIVDVVQNKVTWYRNDTNRAHHSTYQDNGDSIRYSRPTPEIADYLIFTLQGRQLRVGCSF